MKLVVDTPVSFVAKLLGEWLTLANICDLEEAMCSVENGLRLGTIYEALVVRCNDFVGNAENAQIQLDWLVVRRIRVSSLRVEYPLPRSSLPKITALLKHSSTFLRSLNIHENDTALSTISVAVSQFCTGLRRLEVANMALCAPFFAMLGSLHNLHDLIIFQCEKLNVEHLTGVSCSSVRTLTLVGDYSVWVQDKILRMCPNLVHFQFSVVYAELHFMPPSLESLVADECQAVQIIQLNPNLKKLKIIGNGITDENMEGLFTSCRHLQELELPTKYFLSEEATVKIADTYGHTLMVLDMFDWGNLDSSALKYVFQKCTVLTTLTLGGEFRRFKPTDIIMALDHCPSLRTLTLFCGALPDNVLTRIAAAPLEILDLTCVHHITDTGVMALVNGCAALEKISFNSKLLSPLVKLMWKKMRPDLEF